MPSNDFSIHCVFRYKLLVLHSMCVVSTMADKGIPWGKISQRGIKIVSHDRKEKNWLRLLFIWCMLIRSNLKPLFGNNLFVKIYLVWCAKSCISISTLIVIRIIPKGYWVLLFSPVIFHFVFLSFDCYNKT